jgi:hypothetical protein
MKSAGILIRPVGSLLAISLLVIVGCTTPTKQPTTVGPYCNISWDKTNNPKVAWYQLTLIDQSKQAKIVRFVPSDTTTVSCREVGANHEGVWEVTVQSCYDKSTCGLPTEAARMHITSK